MLKQYAVISEPPHFYLAQTLYSPFIPGIKQNITYSSAKRLMAYGLKQPSFYWQGNTIKFFVRKEEKVLTNENDVLPEEIERIEEVIKDFPVEYKGKGPYSENEMSKILDYFGVEDDVSEK